jgi:hypothetical protein
VLRHQGFDLRPKVRIALALHVARGEDSVPPGGLSALDGSFLVINPVIPQDFRLCGIRCRDLATAMDNALRLIKVHRFGDVVRNNGIVLPEFGDKTGTPSRRKSRASSTAAAAPQLWPNRTMRA